MLSEISDKMRQNLPNCPARFVDEILSLANGLIAQEEFSLSSFGSFHYGSGTKYSYSYMGQFRNDTTQNAIKMVLDDGTDKLKPVVDKCLGQISKSCGYQSILGESAVKECVVQQAATCQAVSPKTQMVYEFWTEGKEVCESLEVNGSFDKVVRCFKPVGELEKLPLLSEICTWNPPAHTPPILSSTNQMIVTAIGAGSLFLAINRFGKEGICNKAAGLALSAVSLGSFVLLAKFS